MSKNAKTNAVRIVENAKISHTVMTYDVSDENYDGVHAAQLMGMNPDLIFKTLVVKGDKTGLLVCCIPVNRELDLKKAAKASGNKSTAMIAVKELLPLTGYVRGGCSPVGMKKQYPTLIDESARQYDQIGVSAGARGQQMLLSPLDLCNLIGARFSDIT